jgi:DNA-binding transcriptional LysR family regulator
MYNITFQQIEVFLNVARYKNLSLAAERMYISQPALSRTLSRFEESIGARVFNRSNKGVELTSEGEYLYSQLEPLYNNMSSVIKSARGLAAEERRALRIIEPISYDAVEDFDIIKDTVRQYVKRNPDVIMSETLCDFAELRQQLEYGNTDLTVTQDFALSGIPNISRRIIGVYNMYIAISEGHELAAYDDLTKNPDRLQDETLYIVPQTGTLFDKEQAFMSYRQMGFSPKHIEFVPNFPTLLHTIRRKKGYSICGRFKHIGADDIKYYPIPLELNPARVIIAWRGPRLSQEAKNFLAMLPETEI